MLKAWTHDPTGKPLVLLGITAKNVEKLMDGLPILVNLNELDDKLFDANVIILYGKDEKHLETQLIGDAKVGEVIRDKPQTLRQDFIQAVEHLLKLIGGIENLHEQREIQSAFDRTVETLKLMKD